MSYLKANDVTDVKTFWGAGEMEEVLRALGALSEDSGYVLSTHITIHNTCSPGS